MLGAGCRNREGRAEARVARPALQATLSAPRAASSGFPPAPGARSPDGDALTGSSP